MAKTWAERHPHPGAPPPQPSDEQPTDAEQLRHWWDAVWAWNAYVADLRRHDIAASLDQILEARELRRIHDGTLNVRDTILIDLAASFLDGTLMARDRSLFELELPPRRRV